MSVNEDEIKQAYAIWRGDHRGTQPPPHWDHLGDDMQQVAVGMYEMGKAAVVPNPWHAYDDVPPSTRGPADCRGPDTPAQTEMIDPADEQCPGCYRRFKQGDITDTLPWPFSRSTEQLKWHLRCHQDAYYRHMQRVTDLSNERYAKTGKP